HSRYEAPDPFANSLRLGVGEVQPEVPASLLAVEIGREETISRDKGHVLLQSLLQKNVCVHALGQGDPEEQSSLRTRPGYLRRKVPGQGVQHVVAALPVDDAQLLHMLVEKVVAGHFVGDSLRKG